MDPCRSRWAVAVAGTLVAAAAGAADAPRSARVDPMNAIADRYVSLVLAVGVHDPDYVDAYYGPPEKRKEAEAAKRPLEAIRTSAVALLAELDAVKPGAEELERLRHQYLKRQLQSLVSRVDMLSGTKLTFDAESEALYDAVAPHLGEDHFRPILAELEQILPGEGPLIDRYTAFRDEYVIPKERLDAVFKAAIDECRRRTLVHVALPPNESFTVEYVAGKSWSAYNWYQGNFRSVIQVNTDLPVTIDRAIDLAWPRGVPRHHVYNVLAGSSSSSAAAAGPNTSVYPLVQPQSLIAEGTDQLRDRGRVPGRSACGSSAGALSAGRPRSGEADATIACGALSTGLYAGNQAARQYLEGKVDAAGAAEWLRKYALMPADRARQRVRFFDQYRSYVINYNLGQDMVRAYVESRGGTADRPDARWREFTRLLASPRLPGGLRTTP